jgi:hypothetical protein
MAQGRSLPDFERVYMDGYDLSGYAIETGEHGVDFNPAAVKTLADGITGSLPRKPSAMLGPIVGVFDNTPTSGLHVLSVAGIASRHNLMVARGVRADPAFGDDVFCAPMLLTGYKANGRDGIAAARLDWAGPDVVAGLNYGRFFGHLLHEFKSEAGANAADTNVDNGAASAAGGWLMYHIYSITGAGTVTVSIDESSTGNSGWAALTGATSGAIATASAPTSGIVQLATTAAVKRYLRWQLALGGSATAAVFALGFMRG